jgi:UDP-glucose 4-epimerase
VKDALHGRNVTVVKNDGTQFIWAGDLATLNMSILHSTANRKTYFGLSKKFISWESIAKETIRKCHSKSKLEIEERNWSDDGTLFNVSDMKNDFHLEFDGWSKIIEHLEYYMKLESKEL